MITPDRVFAAALAACAWLMLLGLPRPGAWTRLWRVLRRTQAPRAADMARHPAGRHRVPSLPVDGEPLTPPEAIALAALLYSVRTEHAPEHTYGADR